MSSAMERHIIIPDTQVRPGVPTEHLEAAGNFALEWAVKTQAQGIPCRIIHLGDHWDLPSLSTYNAAKEREGLRLEDDLEAGSDAMHRFMQPFLTYNKTRSFQKKRRVEPDFHFCFGNHENRLNRYVSENPTLDRSFGNHTFGLEGLGWTTHQYQKILRLGGVSYSHNFYNLKNGRAISGMMETRLKTIGFSFTQGHEQGLKYGRRVLNDGSVHIGIVAGSFYQHVEEYLGPQGSEDWHGIIVKHRVQDGRYAIMEVTMDYLLEEYL